MSKQKRQRHPRGEFAVRSFKTPAGETVWRVSGMKMDGTRTRFNFKTENEALAEKQKLWTEARNFEHVPLLPTRLTREQLADAERAYGELKTGNLAAAVEFFNRHWQNPLRPLSFHDAVKRFLDEQKQRNVRPTTLANLKARLGALVEHVPSANMVSEIMPETLNAWLNRDTGKHRGFRTKKNDRLALSLFFNWATRNKACVENPMPAVLTFKAEKSKPHVFDVPTVRRLLSAASQYENGRTVPYFALCTFCALRPSEAARLTWDRVDLTDEKLIEIDADATKKRDNGERHVAISENALEWLAPHALTRTPIAISRPDFLAVKAAAGIEGKWPQDVLRHTAISNYQAKHQHEGQTALWAGNSPKIVKKHYLRALKPKAVAEFWGLTPANVAAEIIDLSNPKQAAPENAVEARAVAL